MKSNSLIESRGKFIVLLTAFILVFNAVCSSGEGGVTLKSPLRDYSDKAFNSQE